MPVSKDLEGKIAVITGANSGIGLETCVQLGARGCEVVLCCRNMKKAEEARKYVVKKSKLPGDKVHIVQLDLADLDNVEGFRARYDAVGNLARRPVDFLILNAGVMAPSKREVTKQGLELMIGTNVIGHFKFQSAMFDLCKAAKHCRIVILGSFSHLMVKKMDLDDLNAEKSYKVLLAYGTTKVGCLLLMHKLNRMLEEKGVTNVIAVAAHPGYTRSGILKFSSLSYFNWTAQGPAMGAKPTVLAATDPNAKPNDYAGPKYMVEMRGPARWGVRMNALVKDQSLQDTLWEKCEEITKADFAGKI